VTAITSIFRPNATTDADGNNEPSHDNKDTSTTTTRARELVVRLLRCMSSYQRDAPKQPTQSQIDGLYWLTTEDVDNSFNSVDEWTQKAATWKHIDPPVMCLIIDKESGLALKLCTTIQNTSSNGIQYNQKNMSLWGVLELIGHRNVPYTKDAIEENNNEVMYGLIKVFFYNRKEDVPKDIKWHDTPEERLDELKEVARKKGKKNRAVNSKADGYVVYLANDNKAGPSGEPLTSFRIWSGKEGGIMDDFSRGGFGVMLVGFGRANQKRAKAPGPEGMLFKNVFWVSPCSEEEREKAKANEDTDTIKRIVKKNLTMGHRKLPAVWVPSRT